MNNYNLDQRQINKIFYQVNTKVGKILSKDYEMWDLVDSSGLILAHAAAKYNNLPDNFDKWFISDNAGNTVAHVAAKYKTLPKNFNQWLLANKEGVTVAHIAAENGTLPIYFELWSLADSIGETVAHVAARYKTLPVSFGQWNIADNKGVTVAHVGAKHASLPIDFDMWNLADDDMSTVAHIAAEYKNLPGSFNQWYLADNKGVTVAHVAAKYGTLPPSFDQWGLTDNEGVLVAHTAAKYGTLPSSFHLWFLADSSGVTVAHNAAKYGTLPPSFDQWELAGNDGVTVAHVAAAHKVLPDFFDKWWLADNEGISVAHVAALHDCLPESFNQWYLTDKFYVSVAHIVAKSDIFISDLIFKIQFSEWGGGFFEYTDLNFRINDIVKRWSAEERHKRFSLLEQLNKISISKFECENNLIICKCKYFLLFYNLFGLEKYYETIINKINFTERRLSLIDFYDRHQDWCSFKEALEFYDSSFSNIKFVYLYKLNIYILSRLPSSKIFLDEIDLKYISSVSAESLINNSQNFIADFLNYSISLIIDSNYDVHDKRDYYPARSELAYRERSNNPSGVYPCPCDIMYELEPGEEYLTYSGSNEYVEKNLDYDEESYLYEQDDLEEEFNSRKKKFWIISCSSINKTKKINYCLKKLKEKIEMADEYTQDFSIYFWKEYINNSIINFEIIPDYVLGEDIFPNQSIVILCVDILDSLEDLHFFINKIYTMNAENVYVLALTCDIDKILDLSVIKDI